MAENDEPHHGGSDTPRGGENKGEVQGQELLESEAQAYASIPRVKGGSRTSAAQSVHERNALVRLSGAIAGFYTTLEQVSGIARGEEDHWNDVAAGAMSGNVLGLCFPGTIGMRLRGAAVGSVAGGLVRN